MRILMISDFYPPIIGGLERHVQTLSHELTRRGHSIAVATLWRDGSPAFERDDGVRVHRIRGWNRMLARFYESPERQFHPTFPDPGVVAGLRRIIAHERPDIVHARGWMLYSFLPLKAQSTAKLVVTLHDYSLVCPKKTYLYHDHVCQGPAYGKCIGCASAQYGAAKSLALTTGLQVSARLHDRVDRFLAISTAVRDASMVGTGCPSRPIEVVPTFVPDTALAEAAQAGRPAFLPPQDDYLLFVGALGTHKGLRVLLDAYAAMDGRVPLVVIGTERGDTPTAFPPGVTVARNVPHGEVMGAWNHSALGVVPSIWPEPFGQVAIEAMICGRPVVASAIGGLRDAVVDGETGLLVPPGNPQALRDALCTLLDNPAQRRRMGEAARRRARLFVASTVIDRIEQIYAEVLT